MSANKQSQGPARRKARLSAALRANLKRRKEQVRGRASAPERQENPPVPKYKSNEDNL